jgi:hypothetical protein
MGTATPAAKYAVLSNTIDKVLLNNSPNARAISAGCLLSFLSLSLAIFNASVANSAPLE